MNLTRICFRALEGSKMGKPPPKPVKCVRKVRHLYLARAATSLIFMQKVIQRQIYPCKKVEGWDKKCEITSSFAK